MQHDSDFIQDRHDDSRDDEFRILIAEKDYQRAFALANEEILQGNQQHCAFWWDYLERFPDTVNAAGLFTYQVPEEESQRSAMDWDMAGVKFFYGLSVSEDKFRARAYFEKAAAMGMTSAMNSLGVLNACGIGGPKDHLRARALYKQAAELGHTEAMTNYAGALKYGKDGTVDRKLAREWYERASELGNAYAMHKLGDMLYDGQGDQKNQNEAVYWYQQSADLGIANGMYALAMVFLNQARIGKISAHANVLLWRASQLRHLQATIQLADNLENSL